MKALIKPKTQADVFRNRVVVADYIRGLAEAARKIAAEEKPRRSKEEEDGTQMDAGVSLVEVCVVVAVLLILAAIAVPTLLDVLESVRSLLALAGRVVVH